MIPKRLLYNPDPTIKPTPKPILAVLTKPSDYPDKVKWKVTKKIAQARPLQKSVL